ncbi:ABC transporter permease [Metabacillus idriensis]|uniref:ABC transporter permease n=1 Tax=Metabacillus idriensis TaxID=324768 RepID=UPI00174E6CA7|nr:ABC transporter permease [Metabacillus idriensis]
MSYWDSFKISLKAVFAHKLRSILTILGIVIGVSSIIIIVSIGQGGEAALKSNFAGEGNNTIDILFSYHEENFNLEQEPPTYNQTDLKNLSSIPEVQRVIPKNSEWANATGYKESRSIEVIGINEDYFSTFNLDIIKGSILSEYEMKNSRRVVLISEKTADSLFENQEPVGNFIEIEGISLKVAGIYKDNNPMNLSSDQALVPITVWPMIFKTEEISSLTIQTENVDQLEIAGDKAVSMLNSTKKLNDLGSFEVFNMQEIQEGISSITRIMTAIIGAIASISLFVGGIGVMNIMLVSVTERTREIGIRKALGATKGKILLQFLIESAFLTLIGGLVGILLGYLGSYIVTVFTNWPFIVSIPVIVGGALFSMLIGVIFGIMPANKAASLDPIESLRYE